MPKENNRTHAFVIVSSNNDGLRYDRWSGETYVERLDVSGANMDRLNTFFKDHVRNVDSACGRVHDKRIERGQVKANVTFGRDADSILHKYEDGILTDVSIGYAIRDFVVEERDGEPNIITVTEFDIFELSCVGIGFDGGAKIERKNADITVTAEELRKMHEALDRIQFGEDSKIDRQYADITVSAEELRELNEQLNYIKENY